MPLDTIEVVPDLTSRIAGYLARCRALAQFCSQNGWIDNESLEFEIQKSASGQVVVAVKFTEVIMKGAGCEGRRMPRFARLLLKIDERGDVLSATPV